MTIRARASLIIATVLLAGASVVFPAAAAPAPMYVGVRHDNCAQSQSWSQRVCYDTGDKWFYIYTSPPYLDPNIQFPSNSGFSGIGQYAGQAGLFNVTNNLCSDEAKWNGGNYIRIQRSTGGCSSIFVAHIVYGPFYDGGNQIGMYGGNWNYLVWYLSTRGYDFVITVS